MVRCAKCSNTWVQIPEDEAPAADFDLGRSERPARTPKPPRRRSRAERKNLPALPRRGGGRSGRVAWLAVVALLAIVLGGALAAPGTVIKTFPAAAQLYNMVGMAPVEYGLSLREVVSSEAVEDGTSFLLVEGQIFNSGGKSRRVPQLRGALFDRRNRELQQWTFSVRQRRLRPGQTVTFRSRLRNPKRGAVRLTIAFVAAK